MQTLVVIPARMASTRLPGKPLADIGGIPLVEHVRRRAVASKATRVVVASGDAEVLDAVRSFGGDTVDTGPASSGTARVHAAMERLGGEWDAVVNVQGDMPEVRPHWIDRLASRVAAGAQLATTIAPWPSGEDPADPSLVKVVVDQAGRALYFSRVPVPSGGPWFLHLGLYAFATSALSRYVQLPDGVLHHAEDLEQLRWLEAGLPIHVEPVEEAIPGIDTPSQLEALRRRLVTGQA